MVEFPDELKLEVKTSRDGIYAISRRDVQGVSPGGCIAILAPANALGGPRWFLVPASRVSIGRLSQEEAARLAEPGLLDERINREWSNWILDEGACESLIGAAGPITRERISWCRKHHPPRANKSEDAMRSVRLVRRLAALQAAIDQRARGDRGPQQEGTIHQLLLEDVLEQMGYLIVPNAVGVPDITAQLRQRGTQ